MDMREHHLSYQEIAKKREFINKSEGGAIRMLQRWELIYLEKGAEVLMKDDAELVPLAEQGKGRLPKLDKKVEED